MANKNKLQEMATTWRHYSIEPVEGIRARDERCRTEWQAPSGQRDGMSMLLEHRAGISGTTSAF